MPQSAASPTDAQIAQIWRRSLFWTLTAVGGALLLWYKRINLAVSQDQRTVFVVACALGCVTAGIIWDSPRVRIRRSSLVLVSLAAAGAFTLLACAPGFGRVAGLVGGGFAAAAAYYQLQLAGLRALPYGRRATALAAQFVWAGAVSVTFDMKELPALYVRGAAPNLLLAALALAVAAAVLALKGHLFDARLVAVGAEPAKVSRELLMIGLLAGASYVLLWGSLGLQEAILRPEAVARGAYTGPIRYIEIPLWLGCGWVADRVGRQVLVIGGLVGSLAAAAPLLGNDSPALGAIGQGGITFTLAAYAIGCVTLIADVACYARRPALLAALSFVPTLVRQVAQVLARPAARTMSPDELFLVDFALLVLFAVVAAALLELVRRHFNVLRAATVLVEVPHDTPPEPDLTAAAERYGLTRRETEILSLSLLGLTVAQMAERLFITQATVKTHITNLLRKTATTSRADLAGQILPNDEADVPQPGGPLTSGVRRLLAARRH
ncbi:MAG: helix-turn-helix transcriptional regulator [Bifidobacteriaceae bacterium]|jgi:DNA-binding CsgD family transcriptional regulator|nr:helix-turn-helix transcriptional regulator [Bifidobacteriaceae bacterium]